MPHDYTRSDEELVADIHAAIKADLDKTLMTPPVPYTDESPYFLKMFGGPHLEVTFLNISDMLVSYALAPIADLQAVVDPMYARFARTEKRGRYLMDCVWFLFPIVLALDYFHLISVSVVFCVGVLGFIAHVVGKIIFESNRSTHHLVSEMHAMLHSKKSLTVGKSLRKARAAAGMLVRYERTERSHALCARLDKSLNLVKGTMHEQRARHPG